MVIIIAMATCPECDAEIEVDEFDVDKGDQLSCPECGSNLEITGLSPIELDIATPWLTAAIKENFGAGHDVEIGGTQIERDANGRTSLRIRDIVVRDAEGTVVASAPKAEVGVSGTGLLTGRIRAERLSLVGAEMAVRIESDSKVTVFAGSNKRPFVTASATSQPAASGPARLPAKIDRAAAVESCANACAITAAFTSRNYENLHGKFVDYFHQPFRQKLIPFLPRVIAAADKAGALGAFLSGSGSTIAAVTLRDRDKVGAAMLRAARSTSARTVITTADNNGVSFNSQPSVPQLR